MSTLSDLKRMRIDISRQISALTVSVHDEDRKTQVTQELTRRLDEIDAEIDEIEAEEKAAKEAKKLEKKNKKK